MGKMALRLRRDVQKASYYVWFLGAQEARGLRGSRVILPVIPRLIERSREQEPLKVTLQVSHKGLKIIQGSSKHFIPHSAITCSVQTDDIVACVLLLYNPATRCPLHVHAYRCDSETTAQVLNQQLQILINRSENQKRFNELETRLGLSGQDTLSTVSPTQQQSQQQQQQQQQQKPLSRRFESSSPPRRFDSSLGSDTGTSTRESECSEEHTPTSPISPNSPTTKVNLYDSLAAELRAKLSGNGPPLLLPPRDYDTVHRSKGNLAAIELRRFALECRNISIVGGVTTGTTGTTGTANTTTAPGIKQGGGVISSRGSSGIGSDLAPSPERQEGQTSSDEDWSNDHQESVMMMQPPPQQRRPVPIPDEPLSPSKYRNTPAYIYPKESPSNKESKYRAEVAVSKRYQRSSSREDDKSPKGSTHSREEEDVKPVLMSKMRPFREVFDEKKYPVEEKRYSRYEEKKVAAPPPTEEKRYPPEPRRSSGDPYREEDKTMYRRQTSDKGKYIEREIEYRGEDGKAYRENLTDKQKYRESLAEKRINQIKYQERTTERKSYREDSVERPKYRDESLEKSSYPVERTKYRDESLEKSSYPVERTKYRDESMDKSSYPVERPKYRDETLEKSSYPVKQEYDKNRYNREKSMERPKYKEEPERVQYRGRNSTAYEGQQPERNPYKEPESKPYRESIEKMLKSPVMRYKSFEDSTESGWVPEKTERKRYSSNERYREPSPEVHTPTERYHIKEPIPARYREERYQVEEVRPREERYQVEEIRPRRRAEDRQNLAPETIKVSPKDRFQDAKEKFQQMERERVRVQEQNKLVRKSSMEPSRRGSVEPPITPIRQYSEKNSRDGWSSDEEQQQPQPQQQTTQRTSGGRYRETPTIERYPGLDREAPTASSRMVPAKSLGSLVKGYRHSYAEPPRNPLPRGSGRVGLAAVNPY